MWDELGIAPSDDSKSIRRAYAARLKALDPDRDPAGFARLRQALEWALGRASARGRGNAADKPGRESDDTSGDGSDDAIPFPLARLPMPPPPMPPETRRQAAIAPGFNRSVAAEDRGAALTAEDEARDRALIAALERSLRWGKAGEAVTLFERAAAIGALSLDRTQDMRLRLLGVAAADGTLDGAAFRDLVRIHGWNRLDVHADADPELRTKVNTRLAAEDWYDARLAAANRSGGGPERYLGRLLFKRAGRFYIRAKPARVRELFAAYRTHAPLLGERIDAGWVARIERRLRRREAVGLTIWGLVLLVFLFAMGSVMVSRLVAPVPGDTVGSVIVAALLIMAPLAMLVVVALRRLFGLVAPPHVQDALRVRREAVAGRWRRIVGGRG
jgi:hypothetical protein